MHIFGVGRTQAMWISKECMTLVMYTTESKFNPIFKL